MPASQLKRLKASLRDQGIVGPQKSKKQKKRNAQDEGSRNERRLQRGAALENIRDQFNPFQFKTNARGPKFAVTSLKDGDASARRILGRPGVSKGLSEERRAETLLVEMQRRNKVGGILDRRFGESDPNMTPEAIMAERYALEKQRSHKKASLFDLEDDEPVLGLTHGGKSLDLDDDDARDDFDDADLPSDEDSETSDLDAQRRKRLKRMREIVAGQELDNENEPDRKKSKKEVMEEVIAKSKMHKYERQAAKEDDEDLRLELDQDMADIRSLLMGGSNKPKTVSDAAADLTTKSRFDKEAMEKEYDVDVKKLAADKRARPSTRTKTADELLEEHTEKLQELENRRLKRMRGEEDSEESAPEDEPVVEAKAISTSTSEIHFAQEDTEADYGLGKGIKMRQLASEMGLDDEDDFIIDDDLVASGSDVEDEEDEEESDEEESGEDDDEEDDFTEGLSLDPGMSSAGPAPVKSVSSGDLPYTFDCPQTHAELLAIFEGVSYSQLPTAIQRIRAQHHPKLHGDNREKLANFSKALIQHVSYLGGSTDTTDLYPCLELMIRHVHSLAKMFPLEIASQFRIQIEEMGAQRPTALTIGDLYILTAVGTIFPTSDHFHQVVTPALLTIGRYLGQKIPGHLADYATGTYLSILALQYQKLAKRYMPEVMNFKMNTLCCLAPKEVPSGVGFFPRHKAPAGSRILGAEQTAVRKLRCQDCTATSYTADTDTTSVKVAIANTNISLLGAAAQTWASHPAFHETFSPALTILTHLSPSSTTTTDTNLPTALLTTLTRTKTLLTRHLSTSALARRPLLLHAHRPLAIKSSTPRFEDSFDPNKHYDPDRDRAESSKLRAEHKKERKGAMRELRKDASFVARERLRAKKEKDAAYEKKFKRLVAEVQGEEGREANKYERERKKAKGRR